MVYRFTLGVLFLVPWLLSGCGPTAAERQQLAAQEAEAEARRQQEHQEYLRAKDEFLAYERVGTIEGYEEFIAHYPESPFVQAAQGRIEAMQFSKYSERGTAEDYEAFLRDYPNSPWRAEAQQRLTLLRTNPHVQALPGSKREDYKRPAEVIVTTGPLQQPHAVLGEVQANTLGTVNVGSILNDSLFRSKFAVAAAGATPKASQQAMHDKLRGEALMRYGARVDAIINVTYQVRPDGEVFANGVAVQFVEHTPAAAKGLEERLLELQRLRERGLITPEEYEAKRAQLLEEF